MLKFIGTKRILAIPMNRREYNDYRGWTLPENENGEDPGFLVEYIEGGARNDDRHMGYISWSPTDVFLASYQQITAMSFGHAIEMLKTGNAVARAGWNGKGMFLYLVPANAYPAQTGVAKAHFGDDALVPYSAYIAMKTATGEVVPWLASQTDVLADDWTVVEV